MKQYITLKQWQELTLSQQHNFQLVSKKGGLPTIGRMIEFLIRNGWFHITTQHDPFYWDISIDPKKNNKFGGAMHEELCNALWETIKQILNRYENISLEKKGE